MAPHRPVALHQTGLLDSPPEPAFDRLTRLARRLLNVPAAFVSLVDAERLFIKSQQGLPEPWASAREMPLGHSFCRHVVEDGGPMAITDARAHPRVRDNPAVLETGVVAYLGAPLRMPGGQTVGAFCAIDKVPRAWSEEDAELLRDMAELAAAEVVARHDAAERRRAETALRESEARLALALEGTDEGLWDWNIATGAVWFSDRWQTMLGYAPGEVEPHVRSWERLVHPDDMPEVMRVLTGHLEGRVPLYECEHRVRAKDGRWVWILDRGKVVERDAEGRPLRAVGTHADVTGRKMAEARQGYRLALGQALRDLADPVEMMEAATALLGRHLGVAQVGFGEVDEAQAHVTVRRDWNDGRIASVVGTWRMEDFGPAFIADMKAGRTVAIPDVTQDPRTNAPSVVKAYQGIETRAVLDAALIRGGRMVAMLFIHHPEPRHWTAEEVEAVEETCQRLWAAVERASAEERLRRSEARLRDQYAELDQIYRYAPVGLFTFDREYRFRRINERMAEINGFPVEYHFGRSMDEIVPDLADHLREVYRPVLERGEPVLGVELHGETPRAPGIKRDWLASYFPLRSGAGEVVGLIGAVLEVTDRKRAEAALRESEERVRLAVEGAGMATWDVALSSGEATWTPSHFAMLGYPPRPDGDATYGMWRERLHPDDAARVSEAAERCTRDGEPYDIEYRITRADTGEERWLSAFGRRVEQADGPHFVGVLFDITERRAAEAALAEGEARLRLAVRSAGLGVWEFDLRHDRWRLNARAVEITGARVPAETWVPAASPEIRAWFAAIHPEDAPGRDVAHARIRGGGSERYEAEYRVARAGGGWAWIAQQALVVERDPRTGAPLRLVGVARDVTGQREAEAVLARDKAGLKRLVEERTAALLREVEERRGAEEALRQGEKLQAIGRLTGGIAHDFNNILQVVTSGAALLRHPRLTEERRAAVLDGMAKAAQNAKELTGRLLAFARKQTLQPEAFDLNARLEGMSELLRRTLGSRIRVETDLAPGLPPAVADPNQLEVALLNLAVNARDAMLPEGGVIALRTRAAWLEATSERAAGEYVCVAVQDTGPGIPPAVLARVFEPFFTTKGPDKGTGLGLAQVHGFAKQSHGDVAIESAPGEGTTVTLHLPRAAEAARPAAAPAPAPVSAATGAAMQRAAGRAVLVVDDNPEVAAFAAAMLEGLGYATLGAANAAEALALLGTGQAVDAVFSDVVMPGEMNGVQLAAALRRRHPRVAVVLATGYSEALAEWGGQAVAEVLGKPYRLDDLAAALERAFAAVGPVERLGPRRAG